MINGAFTCTGASSILIMLGIKRVENNAYIPEHVRGRCVIVCSRHFSKEEFGNFVQWASQVLSPEDFALIPSWNVVRDWPGNIVGACDYEACGEMPIVQSHYCPSTLCHNTEGSCWWKLSNIVCFDHPIPCHGNVEPWNVPPKLCAMVAMMDALSQCVGAKVSTPSDAERLFRLVIPIVGECEGLFVLPLDAESRALSEPVLVSVGSRATTIVRPNDVFGVALKKDATALVIAHNHPSGDHAPSIQDRQLTYELVCLGKQLGICVVDHLVIGKSSAVSVIDMA